MKTFAIVAVLLGLALTVPTVEAGGGFGFRQRVLVQAAPQCVQQQRVFVQQVPLYQQRVFVQQAPVYQQRVFVQQQPVFQKQFVRQQVFVPRSFGFQSQNLIINIDD